MVTVGDQIEETRRHLQGMQRPEFNFLTSTITSGATTLTFDLPQGGIQRNGIISIDDEMMFVKSVSAQVATVSRGWLGTTAAAHTAAATIEVNPRFPRFAIKEALKEEIRSWPTSLYWVDTITVASASTSTTDRSYDLTSVGSFYAVRDVRHEPFATTTGGTWPVIDDWEVARNLPTADFASGSALFLAKYLEKAARLQLTVTKPFVTSTWADSTDMETTVKLASSMLDIPPMGAAWRLLAPRETQRTFTEAQSESRLAQDVPPGATITTAERLKRLRDLRIVEEGDRLARQMPLRW